MYRKWWIIGVLGMGVGIALIVGSSISRPAASREVSYALHASRDRQTSALPGFCGSARTVESFAPGPRSHGAHPRIWIAAKPTPVKPGSRPALRVVNGGTEELALGAEYVQRFSNGSWIPVRYPSGDVQGLAITVVPSNSVSRCVGPLILRSWTDGAYRWLVRVKPVERDGLGEPFMLVARFRVRG